MREILFRGKRTDNDEWAYGFYLYTKENTHPVIIDIRCRSHIIYPETVGQYTGLTDKNGIKIFEGDILAARLDEDFPENNTIVEVVWHEYGWYTKEGSAGSDALVESDGDLFEVIGNIHDNPKLLMDGA